MSETKTCVQCRGLLWICEAHPERPWPHEGCRGAGDPCPVCNLGPNVKDPTGFKAHAKGSNSNYQISFHPVNDDYLFSILDDDTIEIVKWDEGRVVRTYKDDAAK